MTNQEFIAELVTKSSTSALARMVECFVRSGEVTGHVAEAAELVAIINRELARREVESLPVAA